MADKVGPTVRLRILKPPSPDTDTPQLPIVGGSVILLFAIFMISLCKSYWQFFLAQGVLLGIGMSFVAIPASGIVPSYFVKSRALVSGISVAGSSLGGVIWPIVFDRMLHHLEISFSWAMRIAAFIMMPLLAFCILTVRKPPLPDARKPDNTKEAGTTRADTPNSRSRSQSLAVLRKPPFVLLSAGLLVAILGFFTPYFYLSTYASSLGMSSSLSFYFISIINAASLLGRILPGIVADRWGRFNIMVLSMLTGAVVAFCWTRATSIAGLVVWTLAYGFASGVSRLIPVPVCGRDADFRTSGYTQPTDRVRYHSGGCADCV